MVLCCSLTVRALSLFQIVQRGVQMVGSALSRRREKRGEKTREDWLPFPPSSLPSFFISSLIFRPRFSIWTSSAPWRSFCLGWHSRKLNGIIWAHHHNVCVCVCVCVGGGGGVRVRVRVRVGGGVKYKTNIRAWKNTHQVTLRNIHALV